MLVRLCHDAGLPSLVSSVESSRVCRTHYWCRGRTKDPQNVQRSVALPNKEARKAFRVCASVSAWARPNCSRVAYLDGSVLSSSSSRPSPGRADSPPPANIARIIFTLRLAEINPQPFAETSQPGFRKCSDETTTDIE